MKYFLHFIFIFSLIAAQAQYVPMLNKDVQWHLSYSESNVETWNGYDKTSFGFLKTDTLINDSIFYQYWECIVSEYRTGPGGRLDTTYSDFPCRKLAWYYEDTLAQKVYKADLSRKKLRLIWDFDVQPGDTLYHHFSDLTIDSIHHIVDSIGMARRVFFISSISGPSIQSFDCHGSNCGIYIEGIGAFATSGGGLAWDFNYIINGPTYPDWNTNCFSSDGKRVLGDDNCWHTLSLENYFAPKPISLHPNPTSDIIQISTAKAGAFQIYNSTGKLVLAGRIQSGNHKIELNNLVKGIYTLHFISTTGTAGYERFLKLD